VHLGACPWGQCFDETTESCVGHCQGTCSGGGAAAAGVGAAGAHQGRDEEEERKSVRRLRGQREGAEVTGAMASGRIFSTARGGAEFSDLGVSLGSILFVLLLLSNRSTPTNSRPCCKEVLHMMNLHTSAAVFRYFTATAEHRGFPKSG